MTTGSEDLLKRIGANISRIRQERGLTVSELASRADMEKSNLIPIEKGRINVTIRTLKKIADALGMTVSELTDV